MKKLSDVDEAKALHVWLLESGDVTRTSGQLGKGFGEGCIKHYAETDFWQLMLGRQQRHLQTTAAASALATKEMEIKMLGALRSKMFTYIMGKKNPDYDSRITDPNDRRSKEWEIKPLRPASFEASGRLLIETIRSIHEIEDPAVEEAGRPTWMEFVRDQVAKGGEVTISGPKKRDPQTEIPRALDDDDPFNLRGSPHTRLRDVEDRG